MSDTTTETARAPLVDGAAVKAANDRVLSTLARLTQAEADREDADKALEKADQALNDHLHAVGQGATQADAKYLQAVNDATTQRDFKGRVVDQLVKVVAEEKNNVKLVRADAYAPLYERGRSIRLQAAQKVDSLRAELAAAVAEFQHGNGIIRRAFEAGANHAHAGVPNFLGGTVALGLSIQTSVPDFSEQHERNLWSGQ